MFRLDDTNALTSIGVGVSAEGEPHMGIWQAIGTGSDSKVFYHYLPNAREKVEIKWNSFRWSRGENDWAGVASFSSVTYNDRDFSPWTSVSYEGSPQFGFQITLFCG